MMAMLQAKKCRVMVIETVKDGLEDDALGDLTTEFANPATQVKERIIMIDKKGIQAIEER